VLSIQKGATKVEIKKAYHKVRSRSSILFSESIFVSFGILEYSAVKWQRISLESTKLEKPLFIRQSHLDYSLTLIRPPLQVILTKSPKSTEKKQKPVSNLSNKPTISSKMTRSDTCTTHTACPPSKDLAVPVAQR
jgi:hypothetical protein